MSEELKPCPFCGTSDLLGFEPSNEGGWTIVKCRKCGCSGSTGRSTSEWEAIAWWNRRAQPEEAEVVGAVQCPASHPAECYAPGTQVVHASLVHGIVRQADALSAALSAVTAERGRLDMECGRLLEGKVQDAETIYALEAERDQLRAEVEALRKAFMRMRNVASGYSNCCEFDSANTRRLEREFEAADELFRSSAAIAASTNKESKL